MRTDRPTVELYFVFALTYCKLKVYEEDKDLAVEVLREHRVEFLVPKGGEDWQEIDTRVLLNLVRKALPPMARKRLGHTLDALAF